MRGRGYCCVQGVRTWLRSSMIVKTEEDPLKEADIMVENFVDHGRLLIVNSLSKHLPHPFLLPAAHKIVNCLGKQARGNLGVERHKSQRENYGTLLICSWSDGVNEILEDHSALNLFERSFKRLICSSDGMCLQYSVR